MVRITTCTAVLLTALIAFWAGCNLIRQTLPPSADVALTTNAVAYAPGGEVQLTLRNIYSQRIGYNLCSSQLERTVNGSWERVDEDRVCTMELRLLGPGEEATYTIKLPGTLADGTYRYVTNVDSMDDTTKPPGDDGHLTSNPFEVQG